MPLYDVSYQRFQGQRRGRQARIWALARTVLIHLLRQRRFLFLIAVSWIPAIIRGGQIYLVRQFPEFVSLMEVDQSLWRDFLSQQVSSLLVVFVALYAGSGAIAADLHSGAVVIYLSKPLSRMDYLLGKALPVLVALLSITLAPGLTLLFFHLLMADDLNLLRESPGLPLFILGYSVWLASYFSFTVLAVSSLTRSRRLSAAGFVLLALGSHFVYEMASRMSFYTVPPGFSLIGAAVDSADFFFPTQAGARIYTPIYSPIYSIVWMGILMAGSLWVIDRRLRSTEVAS